MNLEEFKYKKIELYNKKNILYYGGVKKIGSFNRYHAKK